MRVVGDVDVAHGGHHLGVHAGADLRQGGHDALVVRHQQVDRARRQGQFLGGEVGRQGDAFPHQGLVPGAAYADDVDARGACLAGLLVHRPGDVHHNLAEHWVVTVDGDVDRILLERPQVGVRVHQSGRSEQDVGKVGGYLHSVIVGDGAADTTEDQRQRVCVTAQRGAVHHVRYGMVDGVGHDPERLQKLGALLGDGGDGEVQRQSLASAVVVEDLDQNRLRQLILGFSLDVDAQSFRDPPQLLPVLDRVGRRLTFQHLPQRVGEVASVARMRCRAAGDVADEVPGHDGVVARTADPLLRLSAIGIYAARALQTVVAADAQFTEAALRLHQLVPVPGGLDLLGGRYLDAFLRPDIARAFRGALALGRHRMIP